MGVGRGVVHSIFCIYFCGGLCIEENGGGRGVGKNRKCLCGVSCVCVVVGLVGWPGGPVRCSASCMRLECMESVVL